MVPSFIELNLEKPVEPQIDATVGSFRRCLGCRNRRRRRDHGAARSYRVMRKNWRSRGRSTVNEKRLLAGGESGEEKHTGELQRSTARGGVGERKGFLQRPGTGL